MPQLPAEFNDGDILFAAPMEVIREFLENSLAYRATAAGQLLISTGAGNAAGDNTQVLQLPQTGTGVLQLSNGVASLATLIDGVVASDTALIPFNKLGLHSWTQSSVAQIPVSALPNLNVEPVLIGTYTKPNASLSTSVWHGTGVTLSSTLNRLLMVKVEYDSADTNTGNRLIESDFIFSADINAATTRAIGDALSAGGTYPQLSVMFGSLTARIWLSLTSARQVVFRTNVSLAIGDAMLMRFYEVSDQDAGQYAPFGTADEVNAGTVNEVRQWTPMVLNAALTANATDATARAAAAQAQMEVDAAEVLIAAIQASLATKFDTSDVPTLIEAYARPGTSDTIPQARYGDDAIAEQKLTPQVRTKLNTRAAGGVAKRYVLLDKGLLRNGTSFLTTMPTLTFPDGFDSLDDFEFVYWELTVEQGSDRGQNSQTVTNSTSEDANWPYPIHFWTARESETGTIDHQFFRFVLDLDRDGSYRIASQNLGTNNARVELTVSALKLA